MESLMPSEIARLIYGYLKNEKNEEAAESFLKSSPHLTECYQMSKANRKFNVKVDGFNLQGILEIFGTMCRMINERSSDEIYESKTMIEKLHYLLNVNHKMPTKEDKCVETELNMVDKCVGNVLNTEDKSTHTSISIEANKSITETLEVPSFTEMISNDFSKTKDTDTNYNESSVNVEKNPLEHSLPILSSMSQLVNNNTSSPDYFKTEGKESPEFKINKQICSTPTKIIEETTNNVEPTQQLGPKNIQNQFSFEQPEFEHIPEATSLESMPGLSKEDRPKDNSVVIDTGELVDTFLGDKSLLEKIAISINKSIEAQRENDDAQSIKILDPPTLEKVLDSTQSDPQIKNILDEFLVFNVDNSDDGKTTCTPDHSNHPNSIKSRLRSAKKTDESQLKLKKNNMNIVKQTTHGNEDRILLVHNGKIGSSTFENFDLLHNQTVLQNNINNVGHLINFDTNSIEQEDYNSKSNYVKIAPKITPMLTTMTLQASEKLIFPKRKRRPLVEECSVRSKFRRTNITPLQPPVISTHSIIIEVPNQSSFEVKTKINKEINDIRLPEIPKETTEVKDIVHDTPDDILKPPKNKSMSTPRRRSTHIRCLDFSTPQPKKNSARDHARSKLFCDTPKKCDTIMEESLSSPLPKLQADWGSVNGFESIVKKENIKHWDSDIREMVGAGVLTSDADGRRTRKKKTPRKKIKPVNDNNDSELEFNDQNKLNNDPNLSNESQTNEVNNSNISENPFDVNKHLCNGPLLEDKKSMKSLNEYSTSIETLDKVSKLCNDQLPIKSDTLKKHSEFSVPLETPDKVTELSNELPFKSNSPQSLDDLKSSKKQGKSPILLETPDEVTEFCNEQQSIESNSLNSFCVTPSNSKSLVTNIIEQEKNVNPSNTLTEVNKSTSPSNFKTVLDINKSKENNSNFLETFTSHNYLKPLSIKQPEIKSNVPCENVNKQNLIGKTQINNLNDSNSPLKVVPIQPIKHNLIETPYKCDDAAVDVPETPISKLLREYDPSKLVTPLPCTPEHYDDSLTETPLTKVFRETSYLNRPPISPFPPTPGNSRSVDTLLVPEQELQPEQECSKTSNSNKINGLQGFLTQSSLININNEPLNKTKDEKVKPKTTKPKPTPLKTKSKLSTKTKNGKKIEAKKKQVYETVKVELFGSELSTSLSSEELENTEVQPKKIVIKKKPEVKEKMSGFKPIPQRKSFQPPSTLINNGKKNNSACEFVTSSIKPIILQSKKSPSGKAKTILSSNQSNKTRKSMVHFDDPVEKFFNSSPNLLTNKSNNRKTINSEKQNQTVTDDKSEQLIGLSRYLNKNKNKSTSFYECNSDYKKIKTTKLRDNISKLNNSDSSINYSGRFNAVKSVENISEISTNFSKKKSKIENMNKLSNKSENCVKDGDKKLIEKKNSAILNKSIVPLESVLSTSTNVKTFDQSFNKTNMNNLSIEKLNRFESSITSGNSSVNNTSCVTVGHNDESNIQLSKIDNSIRNMEYLKMPKLYDILSEDGEHEMVCLTLSEAFILLDIPLEANHFQSVVNPVTSPLVTDQSFDVTPKLELGELENDDIIMPVTSTPKDADVKYSDEKQSRSRRSPSFWEDSVHNYPLKYNNDRFRNSNIRRNSYRDNRYDNKYRSNHSRHHNERGQFDNRNRSQRKQHFKIKREFCDNSDRVIDRFKYKEDKRRSYRDYNIYDEHRKGRDRLEEPERISTAQRSSQNLSKRDETVKKTTKRPMDRADHNKTPAKKSKVEHQRLLKNVDVDDFLSVVHGKKS